MHFEETLNLEMQVLGRIYYVCFHSNASHSVVRQQEIWSNNILMIHFCTYFPPVHVLGLLKLPRKIGHFIAMLHNCKDVQNASYRMCIYIYDPLLYKISLLTPTFFKLLPCIHKLHTTFTQQPCLCFPFYKGTVTEASHLFKNYGITMQNFSILHC